MSKKLFSNFTNFFKSEPKEENLYKLDGRTPLNRAIPFGIQHVMAMFLSNITPAIIIAGVAKYNGNPFGAADTAQLIQACMLIAGIGTLIQLFPIWRVGGKLPIVTGISFSFLSAAVTFASRDYGIMVGAILIGGVLQGVLGLTAVYWKKFISPIVSACVVTTIGFSLLPTAIESVVASEKYTDGSWQNLVVALIALASCIIYNVFAKGIWKQLYILVGFVVGYLVSLAFGMVNFSGIGETVSEIGVVALPKVCAYAPKFEIGPIITIILLFLVSSAETIGDTTAICKGGLGRDITDREVSGALACDGFISAIAGGLFGCPPITSYSQNVGLVAVTKVVNRFTIMFGAFILVIAGIFPPIGAFFATIPKCVIGGCSVVMFGAIIVSGLMMFKEIEFDQRATIIIAAALCIGIGITRVPGFFNNMPQLVKDIFQNNPVPGVFVVSLVLSLVIPAKNKSSKN